MAEVKVKPWWQSVSLWVAIAVALGAAVDSLVGSGILNENSVIVIVATAIATILKRGWVENTAIKANAISGAVEAPKDPLP